ncbi:tetratricopeptide-like helical [Pyrenophora seminiperda CCB06]|uniref:Tetratricopeptide-like helical n=1 Tax=Pyrenophora seminiperda CCB06 TaxID=1302712 RepID=A0A3M7M6M2_9PLEO|nr:tetratricopeptide-like helical [Pyrenophora seminiperda CCB06]
MSCLQPQQPFRFLDLPGEIRNTVYDILLCSWNKNAEQDPNMISKFSRRSLSSPSTALLRANKQIQAEASDYMTKRNQSVRITCRGLDVRNLFQGEGIPVITTDAREVSLFNGHVMHLTLSKPAYVPSAFRFSEFEIMMLRSDLPKLCEQLDIESVMTDVNSTASEYTSIHATIKLNFVQTRYFTPKIQERLLNPISTSLRGIPDLNFMGPVDSTLAENVRIQVGKPRWTEPDATIEEIGTGVDVGKRQWQQNNFYAAAESWAYAMRTLERMRHSSSWFVLQKAGGEDFVNKIADLYFTLNLFHAQFLQVDMANDQSLGPLVQRNGRVAIQHLRKCETASARFAQHASATWTPSNQQSAKMLFRHARCLRLMRQSANSVRAVTLIEEAVALAPTCITIREEKDAVLAWEAEITEARRLLAEQNSRSTEVERSVWTFIKCAIAELAS